MLPWETCDQLGCITGQEERKEEEEYGRDGLQNAGGGEGRMFGTFRMKAALCTLSFSSPSVNVSKRAAVTSSVVKKGKITSKEHLAVRNICQESIFQRHNCLFVGIWIICVYFHILELKNNGILVELQGSAGGRGALRFLTQCLCVSQRPEAPADSEATERTKATLGDTGQEKGNRTVSKPLALWYEFTSE